MLRKKMPDLRHFPDNFHPTPSAQNRRNRRKIPIYPISVVPHSTSQERNINPTPCMIGAGSPLSRMAAAQWPWLSVKRRCREGEAGMTNRRERPGNPFRPST
jgi:hypothetical protein